MVRGPRSGTTCTVACRAPDRPELNSEDITEDITKDSFIMIGGGCQLWKSNAVISPTDCCTPTKASGTKTPGLKQAPGFSQLTVCCLLPGHLRYCSSPNTANPFCVPTKTLPLTIMGVPKRLAEPN